MSMARQVGAANGMQWFQCGWGIFKMNAVNWVLIALTLFLLAVVAGFIPFFGSLAFMLAMPVLIAGIYQMGAGERRVDVGGLFALFGDAGKRTRLFMLGLILFGVSVMLSFTLILSVAGSLPEHWVEGAQPDPAALLEQLLSVRNLLLLSALMVAQLLLTFAFFFAVAEVTFRDAVPTAAFMQGARAAFSNLLPLLVFGVLYVLFVFVAAIPFGLGFLLLLPVTLLGGYCAHRDIFGAGGSGELTA